MRQYNIAYRVLTIDFEYKTITPKLCKLLLDQNEILEIEKVSLTDSDFDKLIAEEVNRGAY